MGGRQGRELGVGEKGKEIERERRTKRGIDKGGRMNAWKKMINYT